MPAVKETSSRRMNTFTVCVPQGAESTFLRTMSRNMGWKLTCQPRKRKCGLDRAIEAAKKGPLYSFDNVEDMMKFLNDDD